MTTKHPTIVFLRQRLLKTMKHIAAQEAVTQM